MAITEERLQALKALDQAATPGPWEWRKPDGYDLGTIEPFICSFGDDGSYYPMSGEAPTPEDATFICECRTALPELVAEVERLQAREQSASVVLQTLIGRYLETISKDWWREWKYLDEAVDQAQQWLIHEERLPEHTKQRSLKEAIDSTHQQLLDEETYFKRHRDEI